MRRLLVLSMVAVCGFAAAGAVSLEGGSSASGAPVAAPYKGAGVVVRVLDGDTLDVRLSTGVRTRVRVLGIDSPELRLRECHAAQSRAATRRLAHGKRVRLTGDRTQSVRDGSGRLLAYVKLPGGADLGRTLVARGFATVHVRNSRPFLRAAAYRSAENLARNERIGLWSCGTTVPIAAPAPPAPPIAPQPTTSATTTGTPPGGTTTDVITMPPLGGGCHASYPDFCILRPPPGRTCASFDRRDFTVRHDVPDPDPHRLDPDENGRGCES